MDSLYDNMLRKGLISQARKLSINLAMTTPMPCLAEYDDAKIRIANLLAPLKSQDWYDYQDLESVRIWRNYDVQLSKLD